MDVKSANHGDLRMALVFRGDLGVMTRGKSEGQAAHAACELTTLMMMSDPARMHAYLDSGQTKVVLETPDKAGLDAVIAKADRRGVPFVAITDAARTCFKVPTMTCVLIGPMSKTDSNSITRGTKMRDREPPEDAVDEAATPHVATMPRRRPDPDATIASIETILGRTKAADRVDLPSSDLRAITDVAIDARKEAQAVWRCSISDFVGCLDVLRNAWTGSRLKADREAGAKLGTVLDAVWKGRNPAPADHQSAATAGRALIEKVRALLQKEGAAK
jgi:peptidyl-tRNA hydrolase